MKITMSFNLPEEQEEYHYASKGLDYAIVLQDLDNMLRTKQKGGTETITIEQIRKTLHELASNRNISIWE